MKKRNYTSFCMAAVLTWVVAGCTGKEQPAVSTPQPGKIPATTSGTASTAAPTGYSLFHRACHTCHGNEGNGFGSRKGPSLKRPDYKYGRTREAVMESIRNGRPKGMPAVGHLYSQEDLEALTSYVLSLI
ncbi:MAG TPA: c-type cytochrome [Desulfuromonadales bacterium]|nr:c-type cytochrome [Desulfuromonadales bacterium]